MAKKYFWLKLKKDFFKRHDIRIIEAMPNGKDYLLFYLKMMLESIDHDGELRFNNLIPYDDNMLSIITNTNIDIVRTAMKILTQLNMVELLEDKTIYLNEVNSMIGSETSSAERVRKLREKQTLLLQCNTDVTNCNTEIEIDKEIEVDKDKEIESLKSELKKIKSNKPISETANLIETELLKHNLKNDHINNNLFDEFWNMYDKKVGKPKTKKHWNKLTDKEIIQILKVTPAYVRSTPDKQYRKNPEGYLSNKMFNDEIIEAKNGTDRKNIGASPDELAAIVARRFERQKNGD